MKKADIIVDLQFGSTGKGALAGYLAMTRDYDTVVTANRPNAGHTFIDAAGNEMIHKILPNSAVGPKVDTVLIGPGAVFDMAQLLKEINTLELFGYDKFQVFIHEAAVLVTDEHRKGEEGYSRIGSTRQGAATAIMQKLERDEDADPTVKHRSAIPHARVSVVCPAFYAERVRAAKSMLLEGAQGYSLGIDAGFWPYCTSRNCTVAQFLADMAIPHSYVRKVIGTARTYPIRVAGNSGPCYEDQREITWAGLGQIEELTTVTKKVRRVFTFSVKQVYDAIVANQPDEIFLNFCNYLDTEKTIKLANCIQALLDEAGPTGSRVKYFGHGPGLHDMREVCEAAKTPTIGSEEC